MIIGIQNNQEKGPGYAIITMRTRSGNPMPEVLPGTEVSFSIESPSRGEFLGMNQWVQSEVRLKSLEASSLNGEIILPVGPEILDNLEQLENYRFGIYLPTGEKFGALVCRNITLSPLQAGLTGFGSEEMATSKPAPEVAQKPIATPLAETAEPQSEPQPEQVQAQQPQQMQQVQQVQQAPNSPTGGPDYLPFTNHLKQQPYDADIIGQGKGPGKAIAIIILIIVLLSGLLFAGYHYFANRSPSEGATDTAQPELQVPGNNTNATLADPLAQYSDGHSDGQPDGQPDGQQNSTLPNATGKPGAELSPLQMARGVLRNNPSMEELQKALTMIPLNEENADAYFLLREQMAEMGDIESMYILGIFYDPTSQMPHGSIEKDPQESYSWYIRAKIGGWQSAEGALANLKIWAQEQAANSSDQAQTLLNNWE